MKLIKQIMMAALLLNTALLSACGGGAPAAVAPTARAITTNTLRTFANGDNIQYTTTGTLNDGTTTVNVTGTASSSFSINSSPLDPFGISRSVNTLVVTITSSTTGFTAVLGSQSYYSQDASGTFNFHGDASSLFITTPASGFVTKIQSPIVSPSSIVNNFTQQNGDTTTETITVIGRATVTTGMGTFETYKVQRDGVRTFFTGGSLTATEVDYIVPSIGIVKATVTSTTVDALGGILAVNLTSTASTTNIAF